MKKILTGTLATGLAVLLSSCGGEAESTGIAPKLYTDSLFTVMNADRANYTRLIVARLGPTGSGVINPTEQWEDHADGALLPAQMFRAGAEAVAEITDEFSYSLQSIWPINKSNAALQTDIAKEGLQYVADNPGQNFYGEEELGGQKYFTAVYADVAVSAACVDCHNEHADSPKTDFKIGDVMGGVVIRVPVN